MSTHIVNTGTNSAHRASPAELSRRIQWLRRITIGVVLVLVTLGTVTWLAGQRAKSTLVRQNPPLGRLVDIGGYKLHLHCTGAGTPTVIMEAGLNDFSLHWAPVQPALSRIARVCTYDRAGLGWSERSPRPRMREVIVQELHSVLTNAGIQGPFVVVGHSFGGMVVRTFAQHYPDEVLGMVLVDAAHEAQLVRIPTLHNGAAALLAQFELLAKLSALGLLALSPAQIPNPGLPDEALAYYRAVLATTAYFDAASAETAAFFNELVAAPHATPAPLGDLPLIVISRGQAHPMLGQSADETVQGEAAWQRLQGELAKLSTNSQQRVAEQSGHYIQLQQPELAIDAIRHIVDASRGRSPQ